MILVKTLIPKSEARKLVVNRRAEVSPIELRNKTKLIINRLAGTDEFVYAKNVFCYINSRPGEVDTHSLIDFMTGWGKSVLLPKLSKTRKEFSRFHFMGWDKITKNTEGYWEPIFGMNEDMSDIDLIILPALAVSVNGLRVGYGGGYYDKLLKKTFAPKIVLAFEFQVFDYIESDLHDVRIDKIVTERRTINTREPNKFY